MNFLNPLGTHHNSAVPDIGAVVWMRVSINLIRQKDTYRGAYLIPGLLAAENLYEIPPRLTNTLEKILSDLPELLAF